jgi:hypothetical protein
VVTTFLPLAMTAVWWWLMVVAVAPVVISCDCRDDDGAVAGCGGGFVNGELPAGGGAAAAAEADEWSTLEGALPMRLRGERPEKLEGGGAAGWLLVDDVEKRGRTTDIFCVFVIGE